METEEEDRIVMECITRVPAALERIADALEMRTETDRQGMEMATSFTEFLKMVIADGGGPGKPPTVGDVVHVDVPTDGDLFVSHIEQHLDPGEVVMCKICERTMTEIITAVEDVDESEEMPSPCDTCHLETAPENQKLCDACGPPAWESWVAPEPTDEEVDAAEKEIGDAVYHKASRIGVCDNCGAETEVFSGEKWAVCGECHHPNPEGPAPRGSL